VAVSRTSGALGACRFVDTHSSRPWLRATGQEERGTWGVARHVPAWRTSALEWNAPREFATKSTPATARRSAVETIARDAGQGIHALTSRSRCARSLKSSWARLTWPRSSGATAGCLWIDRREGGSWTSTSCS